MFQHVGSKDIEIASRTKLVRGPFQLRLDLTLLGIGADLGEARNGGTQATQTDTHLVQCFRVTRADAWLIGDDLTQTIMHDGAKSVPTRHAWVKLKLTGLLKGLLAIFD